LYSSVLLQLTAIIRPLTAQQKQKLTAGNQPARSHLASGPAGTHGHIFVQCQYLCFGLFFLSSILLIDKGEVGLLYIYRMVLEARGSVVG
jgi:hypothetical protein